MTVLWYEDDKYKIEFDEMPDVEVRHINRMYMSKEEIKEIKKKPFILNNNVVATLEDKIKDVTYIFPMPENYCYDGASIPRFFWRLVGSKGDVRFLIAALIHDTLCENKDYVNNDRYFADKIFERCLYVSDTWAFTRWLMFHSVDNWQKFCGWGKRK